MSNMFAMMLLLAVLILEILKCGGSSPPMSEKCGGLVSKNGNLYIRQRGINFGSICLSVCLLAGLHKCYCMDLREKIEDGN